MIVRAVFRCDSLRVSLWSTICPFVRRLKKTEEKGPERRSPKGGCCSFFFQFFFADIFNVHSKKNSGDDHLCWWSSPFFLSKGSDFWKAFQRLWLFNVLFLATTVLVDGRRLYIFKRVWLLKGLSFQRVWLFNVYFYRRRPSQLMVVAFILSKGIPFWKGHILKTFKGDHAQSSLCIITQLNVSIHHFKGSTQAP